MIGIAKMKFKFSKIGIDTQTWEINAFAIFIDNFSNDFRLSQGLTVDSPLKIAIFESGYFYKTTSTVQIVHTREPNGGHTQSFAPTPMKTDEFLVRIHNQNKTTQNIYPIWTIFEK